MIDPTGHYVSTDDHFDAGLDADDEPVPEPFWTVGWDYIGGDCGDLPWRFDNEKAAIQCGEDWVAETVADMKRDGDDTEEGCDGWPVFHVFEHLPDGTVRDIDD